MASVSTAGGDNSLRVPRSRETTTMRTAQAAPRLSVVIVNYRQWPYTVALTRQLLTARCAKRGEAEVVVIDNASPWQAQAGRLRRWSGVSLRRWGRNRGFARAVNEGCRLSRGDWFLLLNPDLSVAPDFLDRVLVVAEQILTSEPQAGIVGFRLHHSDGSRQLSTGSFPTLWRTLVGLAWPRARRKYTSGRPARCRVPWVTGCCLLVRRACWQELQGLDEEFFLYYEDVDLCRRAQEQGWSVWYEPQLDAVHHHPLHLRPVPPALRVVTRHSLLTYAAKHWPAWQLPLLAGLVQIEARLRGWWSRRGGESATADSYQELASICAELAQGRRDAAQKRLQRFVQRQANLTKTPPVLFSPHSTPAESPQAACGIIQPAGAFASCGPGDQ